MIRPEEIPRDAVSLGRGAARASWAGFVVGAVGLGAAVLLSFATEDGTARFYRSYLVNFAYFLSLALGALFFVMVTHLTRAGWSVGLRRVAEGVAAALFPLALLAVPVLLGRGHLYEWARPEAVLHDHALEHKQAYLNTSFFVARVVVYFVFWLALSRYFVRGSTRQDSSGDPRITLQMERVSAPGLIAFALTLTFAAFDLLMSLTPHWYSTIYGVYYFAGAAVSFFSLTALAVFLIQKTGRLQHLITGEHYHDLGKLTFAFTVFWAYIAFSQYFLIWYGNLPEETAWYQARQTGQWVWVSLLLLFGHFLLPFLTLLSRHPKRVLGFFVSVCGWILVMHWIDVYWLVMPPFSPGVVPLHPMDFALFVGIGGFCFGAVMRQLGRHPLIPLGDPRLDQSLFFENA